MSDKSFDHLGDFYIGRTYDMSAGKTLDSPVLYESADLTTHAVCVGMTGSGKTGLCISLLEEAALDGVPSIVIDPKGDLGNLLLTFPELRPTDFRPWIDPDAARQQGLEEDAFAEQQAKLWRGGLERWGEDGERIQRLKDAADFRIYTPGSSAGLSVSILSSFEAPSKEVMEDGDLLRDRITTTATSLLSLIGVDGDPIQSREHILLATLLEQVWKAGRDLDLKGLIQGIQSPPFTRVGVMELESFFPAKDRFQLAMRLNGLLAAPGFETWLQGAPLDVDRFLYTPEGKPRVSIFSIAHLSDAERMFFVSLLLNQTVGWMRSRSGTGSLRALVYMDEIFGYLPPVGEPPSKKPFLTLLKQGRAFGVGVVVATQNPVDLDYKALSNAGTWFLGRLQTERDKNRVLDGLEGVASDAGATDRGTLDKILSGLDKRVFLLHNVHESAPLVFHSRWAMSYLRGPLTRDQIRVLMDPLKQATVAPENTDNSTAPAATTAAEPTSDVESAMPVLPPSISQVYLPSTAGSGPVTYRPGVLGVAKVHFTNHSRTVDHDESLVLWAPFEGGPDAVDWHRGEILPIEADNLVRKPLADASFGKLPAAASQPGSYSGWSKDLDRYLYAERRCTIWKSPLLDLNSTPGESERDFRIRLADAARSARDREAGELKSRYDDQLRRLEERIRKAQQRVEKEKQDVSQEKVQTVISTGVAILSGLLGSRRSRYGTLGRATTALRGVGRATEQAQDVERAEEDLQSLQNKLTAMKEEFERESAELATRFDPAHLKLEEDELKPRHADIDVRSVSLGWRPESAAGTGAGD